MANPWFSSDLVWDTDVNFEGFALQLNTSEYPLGLFVTAGVFPLDEVEFSQDDKYLYGVQTGIQYRPNYKFSSKLALAYYHYSNITGKTNSSFLTNENDYTKPGFQQKGNTLMDISPTSTDGSGDTLDLALAAEYRILSLMGTVGLGYFDPYHINLMFEVANNIGFDHAKVKQRTGTDVPESTWGWQVGVEVGHPKIKVRGNWTLGLYYKYLEADAVLDAFTDSDFHQGGTNAQGWVLTGNYGLDKNMWLAGKWLTTDEIKGVPFSTDTVQLDLNARF